ncbi:MAG: hypothetical protein O8C66_01235 [Candidatus Methanoperedens sp.]|nr:hypothetical protein [Candidatus Methanoperedens sp.]MCZ7369111.1 hypothetical protein [Candidatus Methanoperedens sp.]
MEGLSKYPGMKSGDNPWRKRMKTGEPLISYDLTEEAYGFSN